MKQEYYIPTKVYNEILKTTKTPNSRKSGRPDIGSEEDLGGKKVYCREVKIDKEGYDKGKVFWGKGLKVTVSYTIDKTYIKFSIGEKPKRKSRSTLDKGTVVFNEIMHKIHGAEASRGRNNVGKVEDVPESTRIYNRRISLKDGYDKGGAYWGEGDPLYVDFTLDKSYIYFHREHYGKEIKAW